jgi:succinoglycan biosynthesis transport protein ExoP
MQNLHEKLLSSMQNLNVSKNLDQDYLSIMESAGPASSTKSGAARRVATSALVGLVCGILILALIDRIDDRINSLTELRDYFTERVIGQIPYEAVNKNTPNNHLLLTAGGRHHYAESFRNIRSSLFFMDTEGDKPKTLLITSASPGEGKSTAAANLAITLASAGSRVLLIDADLRRGLLHRLFNIPPSPGFSDILSQRVRWNETVVTYACPGLSIIPRGSQTSNPGELFLSAVTDILLREIRQLYDCVILDSAPVLAADDTASLAPKMDGILFLISASLTSARLAKNSLDLLYNRQVKVLGVIFNRMDTSLPEYYYYQYNSYDPDFTPETANQRMSQIGTS